jgi:hypothetical protein
VDVSLTANLTPDSSATQCTAQAGYAHGFSADNSLRPGSVVCSQGCSPDTKRVVLCTWDDPMLDAAPATFFIDPITAGSTYLELIGTFYSDGGQIKGSTCYLCDWPNSAGLGSFTASK